MSQHRRLLTLLSAATLLVASFSTAQATASPTEPDIVPWTEGVVVFEGSDLVVREAGEWITFDHKSPMPEAERHVHQGDRLDGTCSYSLSRTIDGSTDEISEQREVAHNQSTCVMVTEIGSRPRSQVDLEEPQEGGAELSESVVPSSTEADLISDSGPIAPLAVRSAWHRTRYRDPALLTVTRATTNVTWDYNGSCVTNSWGHTANYYWLVASGWSKTSSSISATRNCSGATTRSNSYFRNSLFCVGQPTTYTRFTPNTVRGNANGSYTVTATPSKSGGCSSWLSFQSHAGLQ